MTTAKDKRDMDFLGELEKKLHYTEESTFRPNMGGRPFPVTYDQYTDERMTGKEAQRMLQIVDRHPDLVMTPINTNMGLSVGYYIGRVSAAAPGAVDVEKVLMFREQQLPSRNYGWERLAEVFLSDKNKRLLEFAGLEPVKDRVHYEY